MLVNVERLQRVMEQEGLDGLVGTSLGNIYYLTGVSCDSPRLFPGEGQAYAVIIRDQPTEPIFISSTGESDQVLDGFPTVRRSLTFGKFYREGPFEGIELTAGELRLKAISVDTQPAASPLDALVSAIHELGLAQARVGIDELGLRPGYWEVLTERLPKAHLKKAVETLRRIRKVKTPEEIRRLRAVTHIVENAIVTTAAIAREGVTEYELAREFDRSIVSQGARPAFTLIRIGPNSVAGQVAPNRTRLGKGDTIWFDVGCWYQGYWADLARNYSLGESSRRAKHIYRAMLSGEQAAIDQARAGMTGEQLFDLTMNASRKAGVPHYRRHHVGHGIGTELYEMVNLAPGVQEPLEEGAVVNIETPYYEFGLGALHVEDPFVVRSGGNELLTTLSRELMVIE